ncbi:MAG TPA: BLUF domain-containing protein [Gaiellales bacterium]|jgi:hypothetical protein
MLQIIYASTATRPLSAPDLSALLAQARSHNHDHDVSGILVYHEQAFLQVIEGPDAPVQELYGRILQDGRHTDVRLLLRESIETKEFGEWSMGFVDSADAARRLEGYVDYRADLQSLALDTARAKRILRQFQEGGWRPSS